MLQQIADRTSAPADSKKPDPSQPNAEWLAWLDSEWQQVPPELRDQVEQQFDDLLAAGDSDAPAPIDLPL